MLNTISEKIKSVIHDYVEYSTNITQLPSESILSEKIDDIINEELADYYYLSEIASPLFEDDDDVIDASDLQYISSNLQDYKHKLIQTIYNY